VHSSTFSRSPLIPTHFDKLTLSSSPQSWFKPGWFFGSREENYLEMDQYRWQAAQWQWESSEGTCQSEVGRVRAEELVKELVERGGWMVLGGAFCSSVLPSPFRFEAFE
jgi:hypothetical protein